MIPFFDEEDAVGLGIGDVLALLVGEFGNE